MPKLRARDFREDAKVVLCADGQYRLAIPYIYFDRQYRKWMEDTKYEDIQG